MRRKLVTAVMLGINSGLSYALLGTLFTTYLQDSKIDIRTIGFLSLRFLPYYIRYLWAPFVDKVPIKIFYQGFGHRKSWMICAQAILTIFIISLSFINIHTHFYLVIITVFLIAFTAATYDISMEAYRIELFQKEKLTLGSSYTVVGFRIGLLISGALGVYLSSFLAWQYVFIIMSLFVTPCMVVIYFSEDIINEDHGYKISNLTHQVREEFWLPFLLLFKQSKFILVFFVVAFYKVSDGYLDTMLIPFLLNIGFTKIEIASILSGIGLIAYIFGTFIGGYIISKGIRAWHLLSAEFLAALTNLLFILLIKSGNNFQLLLGICCIESVCSGICNIILINYMSNLCNKKFTGTHFAIFISISGFSRSILASTSGLVVSYCGWNSFFIISSLLSIPSLICIYWLYIHNKNINQLVHDL